MSQFNDNLIRSYLNKSSRIPHHMQGTLTTNKMTVKSMLTMTKSSSADSTVSFIKRGVDGISYDPIGAIESSNDGAIMESVTLQMFASVCALCNEAQIVYKAEEGIYERGDAYASTTLPYVHRCTCYVQTTHYTHCRTKLSLSTIKTPTCVH